MPKRSKSKSKKKSRKTRSKLRGGAAIPRTVEQLDRELTEALERVGNPQDIQDDLNRVPYRIQRDYLNKYTFEGFLRDKPPLSFEHIFSLYIDKYYEEIANIILSDYPDSIDKRKLIRTIKFSDLNMKGILQSSKSFPQDISDRLSEMVSGMDRKFEPEIVRRVSGVVRYGVTARSKAVPSKFKRTGESPDIGRDCKDVVREMIEGKYSQHDFLRGRSPTEKEIKKWIETAGCDFD
jgi:hypothetical protein